MTTINGTVLRVILTTVILLTLSQGANASGYHPPFDQALKEAEIVVLGEVVDAWDPETKDFEAVRTFHW